MELEALRLHCLSLPETTEGFPFGEGALVLKVSGKMFFLIALDNIPPSCNFKHPPERGEELRERWPALGPGYHMNKTHWSTLQLDGSVPESEIRTWVVESWRSVVAGMSKKRQAELLAQIDS
jgi:predicted DNA-binding protein (MmcQ/YjbR family)